MAIVGKIKRNVSKDPGEYTLSSKPLILSNKLVQVHSSLILKFCKNSFNVQDVRMCV